MTTWGADTVIYDVLRIAAIVLMSDDPLGEVLTMHFVQAKDECLYAAEKFLRIGPSVTRQGEWLREVEVEGVGLIEFYGFRIEQFLRQPVQSFPAEPGTFLVHLSDDEANGYWKSAVIGWSVARDGHLYPITAEGVNDGLSHTQYVLTPDGRVSLAESGSWDSLDHFLRSEANSNQALAAE